MDEGWIEWNGGDCPVEPQTKVEVNLRGIGPIPRPTEAGGMVWEHRGLHGFDIVAYRVVKA